GLIRNNEGARVGAFSANIGKCTTTRAELRGVITGLRMAWYAGCRKVEVRVDSRAALALINAQGNPTHQHAGEVITIRQLIDRDWEVKFTHTYREANQAVDYLAGIDHGLPLSTHSIPISDCNLVYFLRHDCMGISEPRFVTS
ncbi:Putative ribonuclease H protein At1g65750, partial [Linum perenne]